VLAAARRARPWPLGAERAGLRPRPAPAPGRWLLAPSGKRSARGGGTPGTRGTAGTVGSGADGDERDGRRPIGCSRRRPARARRQGSEAAARAR